MRPRVSRSVAVAIPVALASLVGAAGASAHGGATVAEGGTGGVTVLLQAAEATTPAGKEAVDLSTTIEGPGTGPKATVTYWIRPAGKKSFKVETERDEAGIAHTDVAIANRGSWRNWDISAVVDLSTGKRLRVSNAEANPPGPDPASTAGGGATGADADEDSGTTTAQGAGTATGSTEAQGTTETTTTEGASGTADGTSGAAAAEVTDVTGESNGTPGWVVPSAIVLVLAGVAVVLVRRRRAG
jgi:hypothetical protein